MPAIRGPWGLVRECTEAASCCRAGSWACCIWWPNWDMSVREEREERRVEGNSVRGESTASFLRSIAVHGMTNAMYRKQCIVLH